MKEVRIASLNVHMWHKAAPDHGPNLELLARMLEGEEMDVLLLQEAYQGKRKGRWMGQRLGLPHVVTTSSLWLLSRFPIEQQCATTLPHSREIISARLLLAPPFEEEPALTLDVHGTHLCHIDEDNRLLQFKAIQAKLASEEWRAPHVLAGDFNALLLSDYTKEALEEVEQVRAASHWEAPDERLLRKVLAFYDEARTAAGPGENHRIPVEAVRDSRGAQYHCGRQRLSIGGQRSHLFDEMLSESESEEEDKEDAPLLSTCRFGTRIDYILLSKPQCFQTADNAEEEEGELRSAVGGRLAHELQSDEAEEEPRPEVASDTCTFEFVPGSYLVKGYI
eukprot:CAMPEP_0114614170 /NCGR_PEP_ID=MMETSP0168-20121206/5511_1 /TAXON_ID=95228 ORGANISM="Vannella sp., Strain DIVA3 517/6/12" /NCGR_SAMPLE_ID=MMETSP0168 /ASSEMBLY_ACC=CAM_ASM_000044 /LENGTH=335 /DNA_ID=CAMNT_0001825201 /DNA_START=64 /DNA_END=1068 /DNA_ORIENTATION=+